jgi:DtxR family transcriptional regulator, Mn-dependent transcriptional regulator
VERRSESIEEYLEAMFKLALSPGGITVGRLAAELGVAPSSVSEMIVRLDAAGLVVRSDGHVELTQEGRHEGASLVRRHRLSERFLVDVLAVPWDQVHDEACRFEHVLSADVEARLAERLGNPATCPHGFAIPDEHGELAEAAARPLAELQTGEGGIIACVDEADPELLRYLASLGLQPEARVAIESVAPFGGPQLVRVGNAQYALGREVAARVFVRA